MKTFHMPAPGILLGALFIMSTAASAASIWSTPASACIVDEADTSQYSVNLGKVTFRANATGAIGLRCKVSNPMDSGANPGWSKITIGAQDPDGCGSTYKISATLKRVRISDNATFSVATVTGCSLNGTSTFIHIFDFANYTYYVGVTLERANTLQNPSAWAVKLH